MSAGTSPSPNSLRIARRLLATDALSGTDRDPERDVAALQRLSLRVFGNLCDAMGDDGCNALLARALLRTEADHPALKDFRGINAAGIHQDGIVASIEAYGVVAVRAAMEALIAALVDILARLIGEDMAIRLLDHDEPRLNAGGGGPRAS